jgi:hypothetical protein
MAEHIEAEVAAFIMQALADDYESLDSLTNYYTEPGPASFTQDEIPSALIELERQGLIQALSYSEKEQSFHPAELSMSKLEAFWFGLTKNGRASL